MGERNFTGTDGETDESEKRERAREREVPPKPMRVNKREPLSVVQYVGLESDWHHVGRDLMMVVVSSRGTFSGSIPPNCAQNDKGRDRQRRIGGTG